MLAAQLIGLLGTLLLLAGSGEAQPSVEAMAWSAAAGLSGIVGLGAYYLALARGTMGLVAPLSALIGASLPVLVALVGGEEIGQLRLLGIVIATIAVVPVSLPGGEESEAERQQAQIDLRDLPLVVLSGLGFAGFYLLIDAARAAGGDLWWPLLAVRVAGLACVGLAVAFLVRRSSSGSGRGRLGAVLGLGGGRSRGALLGLLPLLVVAGLGDLGGNAFFVLANQVGELAVAVVLASLYPVVTTILAMAVLRERLRWWQAAGIALAAAGVVLITGGDQLEALMGI
jgi:drug/metabolite transporter (DMT)-like permease